jgi:hypothetical protein
MATGGAVDGTARKAYYCAVMKLLISRTLAMVSVLAGAGLPVAADDLDAALAAQKKKAEHRIYSDRAVIENRNLEVPPTSTEEERVVNKKLLEMDAKIDSEAASETRAVRPRPSAVAPKPAENKNWLTPALMDDAAAFAVTNETGDAWLVQEMERQQELKAQEAAIAKENKQVETLLREKTQTQSGLPERDRLKQYQPAPQMTPLRGAPDPQSGFRPAPKEGASAATGIFSPKAAGVPPAQNSPPFGSIQTPSLSSSSGFSSDLKPGEPVSRTPLEIIRESSPIYQTDPFADDHMPKFKSSIWD